MTIQMLIAITAIIVAVAVLFVSDRLIDTSSCKRQLCAILTILAGAAFFSNMNNAGCFFLSALGLGIFINYAFPFLLNAYIAFNRKSDP